MKLLKSYSLVLVLLFSSAAFSQQYGDAELRRVITLDRSSVGNSLSASERLYRADVYMANRHFKEAREHWTQYLKDFPTDAGASRALFGMARSNMWETNYAQAIVWFDKVIKDYAASFDGQEALAFKAACFVRLGMPLDAARTYELYSVMFPNGKRIESSYLNIIDAYREAGRFEDANQWVNKARAKFSGLPTETNALHSRIRMEVFRQNWNGVNAAANELLLRGKFVGSMTDEQEVRYLSGFANEKLGNKTQAIASYSRIPSSATSYYGSLATVRIKALGGNPLPRQNAVSTESRKIADQFPISFRNELIMYAKPRGIDPRFVLAIMKQESSFRPNALSPAAARGLLQLTYDTALKYNKKAGFPVISADDLYRPGVNIAIGSEYIAKLKGEFAGLYEAIAASYNGGEDNAVRWLNRSRPKDPAIFTSEVGFSESKKYVFKVMGNYNVYKELYTEDLARKP